MLRVKTEQSPQEDPFEEKIVGSEPGVTTGKSRCSVQFQSN